MQKKFDFTIISAFLIIILIFRIHLGISSASTSSWSEVARFNGSGSKLHNTDYFSCAHVEWRIRWTCVLNASDPEYTEFSFFTYLHDIDDLLINSTVMDIQHVNKVLLQTSMGDILVELSKDMPITTGNFKKLAQQGIYDETIFHRVIDGFMIQGGDPTGTGYGDPTIPTIPDEFTDHNENNRGTIAMANSGPNTGSTQFFINLVDNNYLDDRHPVFGKVIEGMYVVDSIGSVETDYNDRPLENVTLINVKSLEAMGTSFIHTNGNFTLRINATNTESYELIIDQNLDSIPEFPSFFITPLFMIAILLVVIAYKQRFI